MGLRKGRADRGSSLPEVHGNSTSVVVRGKVDAVRQLFRNDSRIPDPKAMYLSSYLVGGKGCSSNSGIRSTEGP